MAPEEMKALIDRRPFQPFRVHLDDGLQYDVLYPELTLVSRREMLIGFRDPNSRRLCADDGVYVSWSKIKDVEPLPAPATTEMRNGQ